jgi:hypothetical protein
MTLLFIDQKNQPVVGISQIVQHDQLELAEHPSSPADV